MPESKKYTIFQEFARLSPDYPKHKLRVLAGRLKQNVNNALNRVKRKHNTENGA